MAGSFLQILGTSVGAISQVALLCCAGFLAGFFPRQNPLLAQSFVKRLATLSMLLFETSLAFFVFGSRLTIENVTIFWVLPLWQIPICLFGYGCSTSFIRVARRCGILQGSGETERLMFKAVPLVCTFQNPVAFLLPVFYSLCESGAGTSSPYLDLPTTDAVRTCSLDTTLFCFLFFISWSLLFWLWGYPMLAGMAITEAGVPVISSNVLAGTPQVESSEAGPSAEPVPHPVSSCNRPKADTMGHLSAEEGLRRRSSSSSQQTRGLDTSLDAVSLTYSQDWEHWLEESASPWAGGAMIDWSLLPPAKRRESALSHSIDLLSTSANPELDTVSTSRRGCGCTLWLKRRLYQLHRVLRTLLQPNLAATAVGILIGVWGPARVALFEDTGSLLRPFGRAVATLGQPAPLIGMLVMSASLAASLQDQQDKPRNDETTPPNAIGRSSVLTDSKTTTVITISDDGRNMSWRTRTVFILITLSVRALLLPVVGLSLVWACVSLHGNESFAGRVASAILPPGLPWLHLVVALQWASVPAQTAIVACARLGLDRVAGELARMYLVLYAIGMLVVTGVSCVGLSVFF